MCWPWVRTFSAATARAPRGKHGREKPADGAAGFHHLEGSTQHLFNPFLLTVYKVLDRNTSKPFTSAQNPLGSKQAVKTGNMFLPASYTSSMGVL